MAMEEHGRAMMEAYRKRRREERTFGEIMVDEAINQENKLYKEGSKGDDGMFDCSGLVTWCANKAWLEFGEKGPLLDRYSNTAKALYTKYNISSTLIRGDLQPGDLIFYYDYTLTGTVLTLNKQKIDHVSIYMGNGNMIHAVLEKVSPPSGKVKINSIDHSWSEGRISYPKLFAGHGRISAMGVTNKVMAFERYSRYR